tara:strand:- start:2246 stop:2527 length:282 start_codon:yes stop_codon:yes gene_type:complete
MKPKLVDLNEIFKDHSSIFSKPEPIKKKIIPKNNINYEFNYNSLFNLLGLIAIVIGLYFLNKRKNDKKKRSEDFEGRIHKLKDVIKNNNEFIL